MDNQENTDTFRDFIPEGEDTGAITEDGFQDFVPERTVKTQVEDTEIALTPELDPEEVEEDSATEEIADPELEALQAEHGEPSLDQVIENTEKELE